MSTFILIHGAYHGAWCWYRLIPQLRRRGHEVVAPDLLSHGRDRTPIEDVSLEKYVDSVRRIIDTISEPIVLVGHSLGGAVISQVAEHRPDAVSKLVYTTAFLLNDGQSVVDILQRDTESLLIPTSIVSDDGKSGTLNPAGIRELLYADCSDEDVVLVESLLVRDSIVPSVTPVQVTSGKWGRIPRYYVECAQDRALTISMQRRMHENLGCQKVMTMETSHSPFFSAADHLAEILCSF